MKLTPNVAHEIPDSGGWSFAQIEEVDEVDAVKVRVLPPRWVFTLVMSQSAVQEEGYVEAGVKYATQDLVTAILKNPLISQRVEEALEGARHEGMEAGWQEGRA